MNRKLLILGGGFGLYGYLPAALKANWDISTLERYRTSLYGRKELDNFANQISFMQEADIDLDLFDGVVIARNPSEQLKFVEQASRYEGHFYLEKPIGATLKSSLDLLKLLELRKSSFSIAYLFRYLDWYKKIFSCGDDLYNLSINWKVPQPKMNSWKIEESLGGGLLSYYGIHLLALVAELNCEVENLDLWYKTDILKIESNKSPRNFQIELSTAESPKFEVNLVTQGDIYKWTGASPFGSIPISGISDPRIPALTEYLSEPRERKDRQDVLLMERRIQELRETISQIL